MGREFHRLSALGVKSISPGKHSEGGGLWLHEGDDGGSKWVLRITVHSRRREMGWDLHLALVSKRPASLPRNGATLHARGSIPSKNASASGVRQSDTITCFPKSPLMHSSAERPS